MNLIWLKLWYLDIQVKTVWTLHNFGICGEIVEHGWSEQDVDALEGYRESDKFELWQGFYSDNLLIIPHNYKKSREKLTWPHLVNKPGQSGSERFKLLVFGYLEVIQHAPNCVFFGSGHLIASLWRLIASWWSALPSSITTCFLIWLKLYPKQCNLLVPGSVWYVNQLLPTFLWVLDVSLSEEIRWKLADP